MKETSSLHTIVGPRRGRVEGSRSHVSKKGRTMRLRSLLNELLDVGVCHTSTDDDRQSAALRASPLVQSEKPVNTNRRGSSMRRLAKLEASALRGRGRRR